MGVINPLSRFVRVYLSPGLFVKLSYEGRCESSSEQKMEYENISDNLREKSS